MQWMEAHQRSCTDARRPVAQAGSSLTAAQSGAYVLGEGICRPASRSEVFEAIQEELPAALHLSDEV